MKKKKKNKEKKKKLKPKKKKMKIAICISIPIVSIRTQIGILISCSFSLWTSGSWASLQMYIPLIVRDYGAIVWVSSNIYIYIYILSTYIYTQKYT